MEFPISKDIVTIIDDDLVVKNLRNFRIRRERSGKVGAVLCRNWDDNDTRYLHREIYKYHNGPIPYGVKIDHKNRNPLDNRLENLRLCNYTENNQNCTKRPKALSKFKGVTWNSQCNKWLARITYNKKQIRIGHFTNEVDAALAYDSKAKEYFKDFASLNFDK